MKSKTGKKYREGLGKYKFDQKIWKEFLVDGNMGRIAMKLKTSTTTVSRSLSRTMLFRKLKSDFLNYEKAKKVYQ